MYDRKWQRVLKVSINHPIPKNIKEIQIILYAEVVGKESFVIIATTIQV